MENEKYVAIVGTGITGLTAAFYLKQNNIPFKIFDTSLKPGGVIQSKRNDDFVWETGPSTGTLGKPEAMELFEDLDLELLETAPSIAGNRYIWKGKKLHPLPSSPISGLLTPLFSWKDKFGILLEPFRPKGSDPEETLASFVKRRLGTSILNYAVDPFVSGVYAGSPETIIPKYALPKLYALEENYGSFIRGSIHKMKEPKTERDKKATKKVFSAKGGLSRLIEKLTEKIGLENMVLGVKDFSVTLNGNTFIVNANGTSTEFSKVVFTGSARRLPEAFPFLKENGLDAAFNVSYTPVMEVAVGFKKWQGMPLDGFGALMPSKENRKILGVLFLSSLFTGRAPEGGAMLSVFMGGIRHPEYLNFTDSEVYEIVKKEIQETLGQKDFSPELFEITRHSMAIPQYDKNTPARIAAFAKAESMYPGLLLGGNGIGGIGMADRIRQGKELALRILS